MQSSYLHNVSHDIGYVGQKVAKAEKHEHREGSKSDFYCGVSVSGIALHEKSVIAANSCNEARLLVMHLYQVAEQLTESGNASQYLSGLLSSQ